MQLLAGQVMDVSAALLNDRQLTIFTYAVQMPYLNMAMRELQELFQLYNIPASNVTTTNIVVPAGTTEITFNAISPNPSLPADLIDIRELWERTNGIVEDYTPMQRMTFLPAYVTQTTNLIYYTWAGQKVHLIGATTDIQIRMDYIKSLFIEVKDKDDPITLINAETFLENRTAALCAQFIGENPDRASVLNATAQLGLDRVLGIGIKGSQNIATRRRPFAASYKVWNNSL